jgi:hypothetical protein
MKLPDPLQSGSDPGALGRREAKDLFLQPGDDALPQKGVFLVSVIHMLKSYCYPQMTQIFVEKIR